MHPDILAYWEKFYGRKATFDDDLGTCWIAGSDDPKEVGSYLIAIKYSSYKLLDRDNRHGAHLTHLQADDWVYPFKEAPQSPCDEATMLRLLKLKAFL